MNENHTVTINAANGETHTCILKEKVNNGNGGLVYRFHNQDCGEEYLITKDSTGLAFAGRYAGSGNRIERTGRLCGQDRIIIGHFTQYVGLPIKFQQQFEIKGRTLAGSLSTPIRPP